MSFSRIYAIFIRQWFLVKSNPTRLVGMFIWLVLNILMWGFLNNYLGTFGGATVNFTTVLLGAIVLWEFTSQIERGVMMSFMEDIWVPNFVNYFASPLKVAEYITGIVVTAITSSLVGIALALSMIWVGFGYNIFKMGLYLAPFVVILFIFSVALGLFVNTLIFRLGPSAEWLGWPIPFVISIVSGVYYPVSTLPQILRGIAHLVPTSYVFESARILLSTHEAGPAIWSNLAIALGLSVLYLFLIYRIFLAVYRHNLRKGSLARFNAEAL